MLRFSLLAAIILSLGTIHAADPNKAHPHRGKLTPFKAGKPDIDIKTSDQTSIDAGNLVMQQNQDASGLGGRAVAIQAVHAPTKVIWGQLLDFNAYPKKVDKLTECKQYSEKQNLDGTKDINVRFLVKAAPGFAFEYYCAHKYAPMKKSLTWSLDYDRDNDFDDVQGHWYVAEHPTRDDWSQVYYTADLALKGWVPGFIMNILTKTALTSAVSWVKRESEAEWVRVADSGKNGLGGLGGKFSPPSFSKPSWLAPKKEPEPVAVVVPVEPEKKGFSRTVVASAFLAGTGVGSLASAAIMMATRERNPKADE